MIRPPFITLVIALLCAAPHPASAADAPPAVREVFGGELDAADATASIDDDLALAERMIDLAATAGGAPEFLRMVALYIADDLGTRRDGHEAAIRALARLALERPEHRSEAIERIIAVREDQVRLTRSAERRAVLGSVVAWKCQLASARVEEGRTEDAVRLYEEAYEMGRRIRMTTAETVIRPRLEALRGPLIVVRRAEALKARLAADPSNVETARQLAMLHLLELDDPDEARKFALLLDDAELRDRIALATQDPAEIAEAEAHTLAEWYGELAKSSADPLATRNALARRIAYLRRYLELHTAKDLDRTRAALELDQARAHLEAAEQP